VVAQVVAASVEPVGQEAAVVAVVAETVEEAED
jgi:hypothetical protein